jgi:hypothetical protein
VKINHPSLLRYTHAGHMQLIFGSHQFTSRLWLILWLLHCGHTLMDGLP